ncbi:hypothetical protein IMG5_170030 [Ichthyophthirius multifiliis]|uniref:histone acetyltransferase n=1 Tax=Ichthyophthirius multifiliis TaxID=5932 RepID=G0R1E6_ICHMU|nr:hypothetical protein IMG5_170030 [Ichthyophthirius multifiliis]EGR28703.1 hypothetical protein IMG5_170030 [Ichthyophthirius multifiliis]|eukprot:XP_004029939.1 hypothetical protein IMG5_170030 [Ichthyophthirius multifiliis]
MEFKPLYVHQIYGQNEEIEGYEGLKVNIFILAGSLETLVEFQYEKKLQNCEDFLKKLKEFCFLEGFETNRKKFLEKIKEEQFFKPKGELIYEYKVSNSEEKEQIFQIFYFNSKLHHFLENYKKKFQVFLKFFIEVASFVEESQYWHYFLTFKYNTINNSYTFVGLGNKYEFMFDSQNSRHRISQLMVLPPFQRAGHASQILKQMYEHAQKDSKCNEITVEDPSQDFQIVRDIVQCEFVIKNNFWDWVQSVKKINKVEELEKIMISNIQEIFQKTKIPKQQIQRIFEILILSKILDFQKNNENVIEKFKEKYIQKMKELFEIKKMKKKMPIIVFENVPFKVDIESVLQQKKCKNLMKIIIKNFMKIIFNNLKLLFKSQNTYMEYDIFFICLLYIQKNIYIQKFNILIIQKIFLNDKFIIQF